MDGYALGRELRHAWPTSRRSSSRSPATVRTRTGERSSDAGFALHLAKPIDAEHLVQVLDELVTRRASGPARSQALGS